MKKLLLILVLFAAFYAHARINFAEHRVLSWLLENSNKYLTGDSSVCDNYADDVEVNITAKAPRGTWQVEGGKAELCGYLKQSSAALIVMQASTSTNFSNVRIQPGPFPWLQAKVSYTEKTTMQMAGLPPVNALGENAVVLVRTFSGLKIKSLESRSTGGF